MHPYLHIPVAELPRDNIQQLAGLGFSILSNSGGSNSPNLRWISQIASIVTALPVSPF